MTIPISWSKGSITQLLQTTNPLIALCLSGSPNCVGNELRLLLDQGIPLTHTIKQAFDLAAVGLTFNVLSYDLVWAEH